MKKYISLLFIICMLVFVFYRSYYDFEVGLNLSGIYGEWLDKNTIRVEGINYNDILDKLDVEITNKFDVSDRLIIEGYSSRFTDYILVDSYRVNIQMSICEDYILLGSPLIKNSF